MPINELPDSILLQIFKKCDSKTGLWKARSVCKRWYVILADSELWQTCDLSQFNLNDACILQTILNYMPVKRFKSIKIKQNTIERNILKSLLKHARSLNSLTLRHCRITTRDNSSSNHIRDIRSHDAQATNQILEIPCDLKHIDLRKTTGDTELLVDLITKYGAQIKTFGVTYNLSKYFENDRSLFDFLPNIHALDLTEGLWVNDEVIREIAKSCPSLRYVGLSKCQNIRGASMEFLMRRCTNIQTLLLSRTGVRNEELQRVRWENLPLTELDISNCYYLDDTALHRIIKTLAPQLTYLKCIMTNELLKELTDSRHHFPLKSFELRRRQDLDMNLVTQFLQKCNQLEALDTSLIPIEYETFENILPFLPKLKWFNFTGNEDMLRTEDLLPLIEKHCKYIEEIGINFYYSPCKVERLLLKVKMTSLKRLNLLGSKIYDLNNRTEDTKLGHGVVLTCDKEYSLPSPRLDTFDSEIVQN